MRSFLGLICLTVLLTACVTRDARATGREEVSAESCWLPDGAAPGMFITWSVEKTPVEPDDTREETLACVEESGGIVTMERTETLADGSTLVTATQFQRDGILLGAWRGSSGGVGVPLRVQDPADPNATSADVERMRMRFGLPPPKVSEAQDMETLETPLGRVRCVKSATKVSMLIAEGRFETWHATAPLPLSSLVKAEVNLPGFREVTLLKAIGTKGARPTLSIPAGVR